MTARSRAWIGFAPLALLLAALFGVAAPAGQAGAERVVGASYKPGQPGARVARSGNGTQAAVVEATRGVGAALARPQPVPPALVAGDAAFGAEAAAAPRLLARATCAPASHPHAYDPRGPPPPIA